MFFFTSHLLEMAYFADFIKRRFLGDINRSDSQISLRCQRSQQSLGLALFLVSKQYRYEFI